MGIVITYVIGTDSIGLGLSASDSDIASFEPYRVEVEERLAAAFPSAQNIDVVINNGGSQARISNSELDDIEREESMVDTIKFIADEVWNHGQWHNA